MIAAAFALAGLAGAWSAKHDYTPPAITGSILLTDPQLADTRRFTFSDGELRVYFANGSLLGQWIQPGNAENPARVATPIQFVHVNDGWHGAPARMPDVQHIYLFIRTSPSGALEAFFRNPEQNAGAGLGTRGVAISGNTLHLKKPGAPDMIGIWSSASQSITFKGLGLPGPFVFKRYREIADAYNYRVPSADGDGWRTDTLAATGIDEPAIVRIVERIRATPQSLRAPYLQSLLIARHGKLVLDEYFNGYTVDRPHDVRSAGKSVAGLLVGRAIEDGAQIGPQTRIASLLSQYQPFENASADKQRITVGNLLSMSAGYACDDNYDASPGNEGTMQSQTRQPDWYKYTLDLPMLFGPGTRALYCSAEINLLGAVVSQGTAAWLPEYFHERFARPMQFGSYGMWLVPSPSDAAYMAGGDDFRPRDFLKFGQLFLSDGSWNGTHIIDGGWLRDSATKHSYVEGGGGDYGYTWHLATFQWKGRSIRAINAGGNGGQLLYVFPELDMAVMITGANYNQYPVWRRFSTDLVPQVLDAVRPD